MNMLTLNPHPVQTMSSREIAELTTKEHKHVKRDCEVMFAELELNPEGYAQNWTHPQNGQTYTEYALPYPLVQTLITGYSIKLRHAVIQRLNELEAKAMQPIDPMAALSDPNALRGLLLGYSEKVIALETKVTEMAVDVQAFDRIARADGLFCITDAAKMLGMRPKDLTDYLKANGWIYKRPPNRDWLGYQDRVQQGLVDHKYHDALRPDGTVKATARVAITPKGLQKLAKIFASGGEV